MQAVPAGPPASEAVAHSSYRFVIAGLVLAAHFSVGLNFVVVSPLLPLITEEYGITRTSASLLVGLVFLIHAAFGLPGGVLVSRFGLYRAYTLSWFLMGLLALSAVAPDFPALLALRLAYGVGYGVMIPATAPLLMQWYRPSEITVMNALNIAVFSLGAAVSVSTAVPLSGALGWQNALGIFGVVPLAGAIAWSFLGKTKRATPGTASPVGLRDIWRVLTIRTVLLLVIADAGVFAQYTALSTWLPTFYHEARGMSLNQAGFVTGLLPLVGVLAVMLGGFLPLKVHSDRLFFIVPGVMIGLGSMGSFLIGDPVGIYASIIILGVGSWSYAPTLLTLPMRLPGMTPERVAVVWGSFVTISGTAMFISPLVVGAARDMAGSFIPGFIIFAVGAWFLLLAGVALPRVSRAPARDAHED